MAADEREPSTTQRQGRARQLERAADRCDELADIADLMGDDATALELRAQANRNRMAALHLLDR